jgi:pimeloyl-ACP methyl ester carboxylesterase
MTTVRLNRVVLEGPRPPILMMHGWGQALASLRPMGELLQDLGTVVLVDLPGFGASDPPPDPAGLARAWGTLEYAERMIELLDELAVPGAHLVGHSFGGRVAVRLASRWPDRARSLTLMAAAGLPRRRALRQRVKIAAARAARRGLGVAGRFLDRESSNRLGAWYVETFGSEDYRKASPVMRETLKVTTAEDLTDEARAVRCPTLLLWGAEDSVTPPAVGRRFHDLIAGSEYVELPGRDHFPMHGMGAHLCATRVREFLARVASEGSRGG